MLRIVLICFQKIMSVIMRPTVLISSLFSLIIFILPTAAQEVVFVGSYELQGGAGNLVINGNYAYLAGSNGLYIVDITDPTTPDLAGDYETPGPAHDVAVSGNYAYLSVWYGGEDGLYAVDVSDPQNPGFAGFYDMPWGYVYSLFLVGDYAYIVDHFENYEIIDISDPSNPTYAGYYDTPGQAFDGLVLDNYAFIADGMMGLHIIEVSDPANPIFAGGNTSLLIAQDVCISEDYAYIAALVFGLRIADISNLTYPIQVGNYLTDSYAGHVAIIDNRAFITEGSAGLEVVDISDRSNPTFVEFYDTPGNAREIVAVGEYIYVADGPSLQILRYINQSDVPWEENGLPAEFGLCQNYPNPFNAQTTIRYVLPEASHVTVNIYDILGRHVTTLVNDSQPAGSHHMIWNAADRSSGIYFYRIQAGEFAETKKMTLLK